MKSDFHDEHPLGRPRGRLAALAAGLTAATGGASLAVMWGVFGAGPGTLVLAAAALAVTAAGATGLAARIYGDAVEVARRGRRDSERRQIMNAVPMMLGYVDNSGCYQMINRTFEEWFAVSGAEVQGRPARDVHDGQVFAILRRHMNAALTGKEIRFETSIPYPGAAPIPGYRGGRRIEVVYTPDKNEDGRTAGFFIAANDVTQRMLSEAQLQQSQKMEAVGQLTGGVAHDFNNLLAVIVGSLGLLEGRIDGERETRLVGSALRAARRGGELTQRLLAFGRRQALMTEITDVNELIEGLTEVLRRTLGVAIEIEQRLSGDLWLMDVDRGQLENALLNLSINARDAMPDGGRLTVETANVLFVAGRRPPPAGLTPGAYVTITVSDTGTGMAADTRERAIEPFFTTKQTGEGSGLGLSMIYGFTKQSGGHLGIDSTPGAGTSVKIYLPADETLAPDAETGGGAIDDLHGRGERVLMIEDDPDVRQMAMAMLERLGYVVIEAATGHQALEIAEAGEAIDLVFTDVFLPDGLNGPEAARRIKAVRPGVPVLFTSGYSADQISGDDLMGDSVQILPKPYEIEALARKLRECLGDA